MGIHLENGKECYSLMRTHFKLEKITESPIKKELLKFLQYRYSKWYKITTQYTSLKTHKVTST